MESAFDGYFVGPAPHASMEAVAERLDARGLELIGGDRPGTWAGTPAEGQARALVAALGEDVWLFEVHLENDFDTSDRDDVMESHSGTITGWLWNAARGEFGAPVVDTLHEEGFVRGGVMRDVALEYAQAIARDESEPPPAPAVRQPRTPSESPGSALLRLLVERGELELVDEGAASALAWRVERGLDYASSTTAAARILEVLDDAAEVTEAYIDEATLAKLIDTLREDA